MSFTSYCNKGQHINAVPTHPCTSLTKRVKPNLSNMFHIGFPILEFSKFSICAITIFVTLLLFQERGDRG